MSSNGHSRYYHFDAICYRHRANRTMIEHQASSVKLNGDSIILIWHTDRMPAKKQIDAGPIGTAVAANIERWRESQNLSYAELSRRLDELGRPIAPLGLTRIRDHKRRVDVDDLVALALALGVSPTTLLLPASGASTEAGAAGGKVPVTDGGGDYPRRQIWSWLIAEAPIDAPPSLGLPSRSVLRFRLAAVPDGVGAQDFAKHLVDFEHLPPKFAEALLEYAARRENGAALGYAASQEKDDNGDD
jgi:transcriptional regulator with XRE-family HTH domain